jgi:hypothetical protein
MVVRLPTQNISIPTALSAQPAQNSPPDRVEGIRTFVGAVLGPKAVDTMNQMEMGMSPEQKMQLEGAAGVLAAFTVALKFMEGDGVGGADGMPGAPALETPQQGQSGGHESDFYSPG